MTLPETVFSMAPIIRPDAGKGIRTSLLRDLRRRPALEALLRDVARAVSGAGGAMYLAGGYLRDLAEGRHGGDVDLLVTGIPFPRLGEALRTVDPRSSGIRNVVTAGKHFPVHRIVPSWGAEYVDVSTARSLAPPRTGRRRSLPPGCEPAAYADASCRDFTVNSMLFRLSTDGAPEDGSFLDPFGGIADLRRRRIRFVGDPAARLREDPVRAIRAVRLASERRGFSIGPRDAAAIRRFCPSLPRETPADRVIPELVRSLAADPAGTVELLRHLGLFRALLPELAKQRGAADRIARRYRFLVRSLRSPLPGPLLLANLLADLHPQDAESVSRRLRIPALRKVLALLSALERLAHPERLRFPRAETEAILARAEHRRGLIALYRAVRRVSGRPARDLARFLARCAEIPVWIDGTWLCRNGIPEGPSREELLLRVREASLARTVRTRADAEHFVEAGRGA
jgi:tRNA nucleotidyltransferase/poly(A) polymerase